VAVVKQKLARVALISISPLISCLLSRKDFWHTDSRQSKWKSVVMYWNRILVGCRP